MNILPSICMYVFLKQELKNQKPFIIEKLNYVKCVNNGHKMFAKKLKTRLDIF